MKRERFEEIREEFTSDDYRFPSTPLSEIKENHPMYYELVEKSGEDALPFLFKDIKKASPKNLDIPFWVWIGIINVIVKDQLDVKKPGNFESVQKTYVDFGEENGYI